MNTTSYKKIPFFNWICYNAFTMYKKKIQEPGLKGNVLIVDDDAANRESIESLLNEEFPEVRLLTSESINSAKKNLATTFINVVITDMFMELEEDGYELLKFIKNKKPLTQVIVLTWYPAIDNVVKCMRVGCFGYISKKDENALDNLLETTKEALELSNYPVERESLIERLILCHWNEMQKAKKADKRGIALESLCSLIFRTIPGWQQTETRLKSDIEEIDIVILNESNEVFWKRFGTLIIVECKNWSKTKKPSKVEFDAFYAKITRRGKENCQLGFFVSINGVAKPFREALKGIVRDRIKIVILDKDDLWQLVCSDNRSQFLKELFLKQII